MKKFPLFLLLLLTVNCAFAQFNGSGYYRVQNKVTERYIRVIDNKGSVNLSTTNADLGALETKKYFENVVSDPASIIYITPRGDGYNFVAQGTSSYNIIGYNVQLKKNSDGTYRAYASHAGATKYLCDENTTYPEGVVLTNSTKTRDWYIKPVDQTDGQYFAFKPTITVGDGYYTTIYASFPFTLPAGMSAYYITTVSDGQAVWKEVKDGKVPASTAVYVKCKSSNYADNKITLGENGVSSLAGNLMKGVYFNNGTNKHNNQLAYNPGTMRVLGVTSEGKLGFITANIDFIPANTAYLVVPANSPAEIKLVSESEYKPNVAVQSVSLSHTSLTMYAGDNQTLTATVLPENATDKSLKWSSSNSNVATADANGVVKAIGYGKASITATSAANSAAKAVCEVSVFEHCTGIELSATSAEMYIGDSFSLTARTLPLNTTDGKIEWSVNNETVIKRNADGTIVAVGAGTAEVIAKSTDGGHIGKCSVTVKAKTAAESVTLNEKALTMYTGDSFKLLATVLPDETFDKTVNWTSSDNNVATVDANGAVKAIGYGKATITAACASNSAAKAVCEVSVFEHCTGVEISATNAQLFVGNSFTLTANTLPIGKSDGKIEWSVSDETVIKHNADGTILSLKEGFAEVTAKSTDGGHIAKCKVSVKNIPVAENITLSDYSLVMYVDDNHSLTAEVTPDDAVDKEVTWRSSNEAVATVENGKVKAKGYGKADITAFVTTNDAVSATCTVQVYEHTTGIEMSANAIEISIGEKAALIANTLPLNTSDGQIEWSISDESIVEFNEDGTIVALAEGIAEIIAESVDGGHVAKCTITVKGTNSIDEVLNDSNASFRIYNTHGIGAERLRKGINIIISEDGSARKIIVK